MATSDGKQKALLSFIQSFKNDKFGNSITEILEAFGIRKVWLCILFLLTRVFKFIRANSYLES